MSFFVDILKMNVKKKAGGVYLFCMFDFKIHAKKAEMQKKAKMRFFLTSRKTCIFIPFRRKGIKIHVFLSCKKRGHFITSCFERHLVFSQKGIVRYPISYMG